MKNLIALDLLEELRDITLDMPLRDAMIDAIKELEELQNRNCSKCKYVFDNLRNTGFCEYHDKTLKDGHEVDYIDNVDNFYCSRFESKC